MNCSKIVRAFYRPGFVVVVVILLCCMTLVLLDRSGRKNFPENLIHPISLKIIYRDKEVISGPSGNLHSGTATYIFKNRFPFPVKLVFPPISCAFGGSIPLTPQCNDPKYMPECFQKSQLIEFPPNSERRFTSEYNISIGI